MATPIVWSTTTLCIDSDVLERESQALAWAQPEGVLEKWRIQAKDDIARKLRRAFRKQEEATDASEVLDLIGNPGLLKMPAVYLTLHLLCLDRTRAAGDLYDRKAEIYFGKSEAAYSDALPMLHLDLDESGAITDDEKYNAPSGVQFRHGG